MKNKRICTSHECEDCNDRLVSPWSNWIFIPILLFVSFTMIGLGLWQERKVKRIYSEPDCYQRDYVENSKYVQKYEIREIDCESLR